jgi:hypothetical protein
VFHVIFFWRWDAPQYFADTINYATAATAIYAQGVLLLFGKGKKEKGKDEVWQCRDVSR